MKKNILAALFFAGMGASALASAATDVTPNTGFQGAGAVSTTNCTLLAQGVTLNLSNNVWGVYACDEATSVISVAACHKGGSRSEKTVACAEDPANAGTYLPAGCTASTPSITITDYVGYKAGSNGGSIAVDQLGGACSDTTVTGLL